MKTITLFSLLFMSAISSAQLFDSISVSLSGGIALSEFSMNRRGTPGYVLEYAAEFPLGQFAFSTGLALVNYGSHFNFVPIEPAAGISALTSSSQKLQVTGFDYQYYSFPVRLRYYFLQNFYTQIGIKPEFFLFQLPEDMGILYDPSYLNKSFHQVESVRNRNVSIDTGLGFTYYPKTSLVRIFLECGGNYILYPIHLDGRMENPQISYSLKIGIKYVFKKTSGLE